VKQEKTKHPIYEGRWWSWYNSVDLVARLGAEPCNMGLGCREVEKIILFSKIPKPGCGTHPAYFVIGALELSPGTKLASSEVTPCQMAPS